MAATVSFKDDNGERVTVEDSSLTLGIVGAGISIVLTVAAFISLLVTLILAFRGDASWAGVGLSSVATTLFIGVTNLLLRSTLRKAKRLHADGVAGQVK